MFKKLKTILSGKDINLKINTAVMDDPHKVLDMATDICNLMGNDRKFSVILLEAVILRLSEMTGRKFNDVADEFDKMVSRLKRDPNQFMSEKEMPGFLYPLKTSGRLKN